MDHYTTAAEGRPSFDSCDAVDELNVTLMYTDVDVSLPHSKVVLASRVVMQ